MKKTLAFILVFIMVFSLLPISALAAEDDATLTSGTLADVTISGDFSGGVAIASSAELTVTIPDGSKTNAPLVLTTGDAGAAINYVKSGTEPSDDAAYTETYTAGSTTVTVADSDVIWLLVTAADSTTKLYYKLTVTVSAASSDATLTTSIGAVDNDAGTITGIPYGTTLTEFKAAVTPASGASFEVYQADGTTTASDLASDYKVIVTAEDGTATKTYTVTVNAASSDATLTSSIGTVDNDAGTITDIPYGTTLTDFKAAVTPASGASFEVYEADGTTTASDLATDYKVIVTAEDGTATKTYTLTVNAASSDATLTSSIGTADNDAGTITDIPYGTTLTDFKAAVTPASGASFEVYEADGTTTASDLATDYKVIVTAEDGTATKTYTLTVNAASSDATLDFTADTGTSLAGVVLTDETDGETGEGEASAMPLSVKIANADAAAAAFVPVTNNAAVTAYADDGTGGGTYEAVPASYDFSGTNTTLWIQVVSEDGNNTRYYKLTVTVAEQTREVKLYANSMYIAMQRYSFEVYDSEGNQVDVTLGGMPFSKPHVINAAPGEYTFKYYNNRNELLSVGTFTVEPGTEPQSIYFATLYFYVAAQPDGYQHGGSLLVTYEDGTEMECYDKTLVNHGNEPYDGYEKWEYLVALDEGDNLFFYYYTAQDDGLNSYESTMTVSSTRTTPVTFTRSIRSMQDIDNTVRVTKGVDVGLYEHPDLAYVPYVQLVEGVDYTVDRVSDPDYDIYSVPFGLQGNVYFIAGGEGTDYVKTAMEYTVVNEDGFDETLDLNLKGEYARDNTVPTDAFKENDLYLSVDDSNYLLMGEGDTERLEAFRVWQTVLTSVTNKFISPDFSYEIIGDSVTIEKGGVVGREYAYITAVEPGISIIKITYEPMIYGNYYFEAIDAENTRTVVVNVGGSEGDIQPNIGQTEYDTIFYLDKLIETDGTQTPGEGYAEYTFSPTSSSPLTVRVHDPLHNTAWGAGWTAYEPANGGSYTVRLKEGRNIIEISNTARRGIVLCG